VFNRTKNISGKEITPYVLQRVNELTKGKSLEASILVVANPKFGFPELYKRYCTDKEQC